MPREIAKIKNFETGEEREYALTQGHYLAVISKAGAHRGALANTLMMTFLAAEEEAWDLDGQALLDGAAKYFTQWDFLCSEEDGDGPLAPKKKSRAK